MLNFGWTACQYHRSYVFNNLKKDLWHKWTFWGIAASMMKPSTGQKEVHHSTGSCPQECPPEFKVFVTVPGVCASILSVCGRVMVDSTWPVLVLPSWRINPSAHLNSEDTVARRPRRAADCVLRIRCRQAGCVAGQISAELLYKNTRGVWAHADSLPLGGYTFCCRHGDMKSALSLQLLHIARQVEVSSNLEFWKWLLVAFVFSKVSFL